jgi:hypothetical protein
MKVSMEWGKPRLPRGLSARLGHIQVHGRSPSLRFDTIGNSRPISVSNMVNGGVSDPARNEQCTVAIERAYSRAPPLLSNT